MSGRNWTRRSIEELVEQYLRRKKAPTGSVAFGMMINDYSQIFLMDSLPTGSTGGDYYIDVGDLAAAPEIVRTVEIEGETANVYHYEAMQQTGNPNFIYCQDCDIVQTKPFGSAILLELSGWDIYTTPLGDIHWGPSHRWKTMSGFYGGDGDGNMCRDGSYTGSFLKPDGSKVDFTILTFPQRGLTGYTGLKEVYLGSAYHSFITGSFMAIVTTDPVNEVGFKQLGTIDPALIQAGYEPVMGTMRINRTIYFPVRINIRTNTIAFYDNVFGSFFDAGINWESEITLDLVSGHTVEDFTKQMGFISNIYTDSHYPGVDGHGGNKSHNVTSIWKSARIVGQDQTSSYAEHTIENMQNDEVHSHGFFQYKEDDPTRDRELCCYSIILLNGDNITTAEYEAYAFMLSRIFFDYDSSSWENAIVYKGSPEYGVDLPLTNLNSGTSNDCVVKYTKEYVGTNVEDRGPYDSYDGPTMPATPGETGESGETGTTGNTSPIGSDDQGEG